MGIQVTQGVSKPAVTYDRIHVTRLEINQPVYEDDTQNPLYELRVAYRMYGIVDGVRHYEGGDVKRASIQDFLSHAIQKSGNGDNSLLVALDNIEIALASIMSDRLGVEADVV